MRSILVLFWSLTLLGAVRAESPAPTSAPVSQTVAQVGTPVEQRTERIRVEDTGARVDELRVGGETKTIKVQPKGGMPAYDVAPTSGERSWKVLGF